MTYPRILLALLVLLVCQATAQTQTTIKTKDAVPINGIKQWIVAEGKDDTKPVLLFLHGGPGFPSRPYLKKAVKLLQEDYIVVQWDQRASGLTEHFSPNSDSLTLELFDQDTYEVVEYLRKRFDRKKIYLAGFSWGGFIGMRYAYDHPENLHAYISVSSMIYGNESERRTLALLREKAEGNPQALEEIGQISVPFTSVDELYFQRKWNSSLLGGRPYKSKKIKPMFDNWAKVWMPVFQEAAKIDFRETIPSLDCPIYVFQSKRDYVSNHTVGEDFFNGLAAKDKKLVWFQQSTHEIPTDEPRRFSEELIRVAREVGQ